MEKVSLEQVKQQYVGQGLAFLVGEETPMGMVKPGYAVILR